MVSVYNYELLVFCVFALFYLFVFLRGRVSKSVHVLACMHVRDSRGGTERES